MYGETNENFQNVLKVCTRMAVARGDSPIFEAEVKGGAYSVTLHLCRRGLAGAAVNAPMHIKYTL